MRSPGVVYRKLREVKHRYLVELYKKFFRRIPPNCRYNFKYLFIDWDGIQREIHLCTFHQRDDLKKLNPDLFDLCEEPRHIQRCNAFAFKYQKEQIKAIFEEELKNIKVKTKKYPDICALEWVLEINAIDIPPLNWILSVASKIIKFIKGEGR